jgi:hypothetical protein
MNADTKFETLFHSGIQFQGRDCQVDLRVPRIGELFSLLLARHHRTPARLSVMFPAEFKRLVMSIDGKPMDIEQAHALYAEAQSAGQIVAARNRLFEVLSEQGRIFARCPHCSDWEAELSVIALTVALQAGPWPIVDERVFLAMPSLAERLSKGARPQGAVCSSRIRFELPSKVVGLPAEVGSGVLSDADRDNGAAELAAWQYWAPRESERAVGREQWREDVPGFRAVLRLTVALDQLDGSAGTISPEIVLRMPSVDFYFLDNLYYLTHNVDIAANNDPEVKCSSCAQIFLPVSD